MSSAFASENLPLSKEGSAKQSGVIKSKIINSKEVTPLEYKKEADLYKLLYENSKSANDRLITTIHWSIGLVATFLLALFGTQIFFNLKLNKEEVQKIRSDLDEKISTTQVLYTNQINTLHQSKEKEFREEFNDFKGNSENDIIERMKVQEKSLKTLCDGYRKDNDLLESTVEFKFKQVEIQLEKTIGDVWELRGVKSNALSRYINTALLEHEQGHELKLTLKNIIQFLNEATDLHERDKTKLDELLVNIPDSYESQKFAITSRLDNLKVYKFLEDPLNPGKNIIRYLDEQTA